ncbi:hypothetical protein OEA41_000451 [Lepraria neglecta]|uniref:Kinesin light chain n=1 Tax=Lepraria neglecta TaxID=209136 RepID=A0AAE0DRD2_9LECA|nr:hypothetical protein OEA41_000451 [Lepraria neglecta]
MPPFVSISGSHTNLTFQSACSRCQYPSDGSNASTLVERLGGLPLALAQAASYMRETNTSITEYLQSYNTAWDDLMKDEAHPDFVLREYDHHSAYSTWAISFECVKRKNETAANFLQVWSCLDNRDIWCELCLNEKSSRVHWSSAPPDWFKEVKTLGPDHTLALHTIRCLAAIYDDQGKLDMAADMCKRALVGFENVLGPDHPSTLRTVFIPGRLHRKWDKMSEAEALYQRALSGLEKILGPDHSWTRDAIYKLSTLYKNQDRLEETETLCRQALAGYKNPESKYTLNATDGLSIILKRRGKLGEAEIMLHEAL